MTLQKKPLLSKGAAAGCVLAVMGLSACQSSHPGARDWVTSPLDANRVSVEQKTSVLEIALPASQSALMSAEQGKIESFVRHYAAAGEGWLVVKAPVGAANAQLALQSVADVRSIANANGVDYGAVRVKTYDAAGPAAAPLVLSFSYYEAVAPDCPPLNRVDMSDISKNEELPTIGCAVNTNLAAMIADPADLRGDTAIGAPDTARTSDVFEKYQTGQDTNSAGQVNATLGQ